DVVHTLASPGGDADNFAFHAKRLWQRLPVAATGHTGVRPPGGPALLRAALLAGGAALRTALAPAGGLRARRRLAGTAAPGLGLDQCVRTREHQPGVPVVEVDQVGRLPRPAGAANRPPPPTPAAATSRPPSRKAGSPVAAGRQRFSIISDGLPTQLPDIDPDETREWVDSFDDVVRTRGRARARYVMLRLLERAREQQVGVPGLRSTDYINKITPEGETWFNADENVAMHFRSRLTQHA